MLGLRSSALGTLTPVQWYVRGRHKDRLGSRPQIQNESEGIFNSSHDSIFSLGGTTQRGWGGEALVFRVAHCWAHQASGFEASCQGTSAFPPSHLGLDINPETVARAAMTSELDIHGSSVAS